MGPGTGPSARDKRIPGLKDSDKIRELLGPVLEAERSRWVALLGGWSAVRRARELSPSPITPALAPLLAPPGAATRMRTPARRR